MAIADNMPGISVNRKENHMLELRKKLSNYQEVFYLLFLLPMTGMSSMGINSDDRIYLYVFAVAMLFLLLKMAVTDFTWREILVMAVLTLLFGVNFLRNGEKTLILTVMAIFGAKNVDLDKVMKYALWEKAVLTVGTLTLAATGVIENEIVSVPKNWKIVELPCYGYYQPNMAFANIFVVLLLIILIYRDKLRWYSYIIGTGIMFVAYQIFMCRTGILMWILLCLMIFGYALFRYFHLEKEYLSLLLLLPVVLVGVTLILPPIAQNNFELAVWFNKIFTGRIDHINQVYGQIWKLLLGHVPKEAFDNMYFTTLYNYGWILFTFSLVAYIIGMWYCIKKDQDYNVIGLGIMSVYGFMELLPLSILWNLPLLYLSQILFQGKKLRNEQLQ